MPQLKVKILILQICLISLTLINATPTAHGVGSPEEASGLYYYEIEVFDNGTSLIKISFEARGLRPREYFSWLFVPVNLTGTLIYPLSGSLINASLTSSEYYFYSRYEFIFLPNESGMFALLIKYRMNYSALIIEPKGVFVSPLIYFSPRSNGKATVTLPGFVDPTYYEPTPDSIERLKDLVIIRYTLTPSIPRIYITFNVDIKPNMINLSFPPFMIITPSRYKAEATSLARIYSKVYPILRNITGLELKDVVVRFFVPSEMSDFSILGFVPFNPKTNKVGEIHLNIFYLRAIRGILEYGAVHELMHHVLWKLNVMPELLWVHEGLAEYMGLTLVHIIDERGVYKHGLEWREKLLSDYVRRARGDFSFLQKWRPGIAPIGDILLCYASAYGIFKSLGDKYGLGLYKRLFKRIRDLNFPISSSALFIYLLSEAAGEDLLPQFRRLGFDVISVSAMIRALEGGEALVNDRLNPLSFIALPLYHEALALVEKGLYERAYTKLSLALAVALLGRAVILLAPTYILTSLVALTIARNKLTKQTPKGLKA